MIAKCGWLAGVASAVLCASMAGAQSEAPAPSAGAGTVSGSGVVVSKRKPDRLRMKIDVIVQGKTIEEALAHLKDRREAIRGQLATLGAAMELVAFGELQFNTTVLQARQQMAMMIMARMGKGAKKGAKKAATPAVISVRLTAEWPLKGKDVEALLVEVSRLQDAINVADLAGKKELEMLSGEDEELSQELEGMQANLGNDPSQPQPGSPAFALVSKIAAEDHARALADAFQKPKARAQETARAAGAELGPLRQLGSQVQSGGEPADNGMQAYLRAMGMARAGGPPDEAADSMEATGTQPGEVTYRVTVSAAFALNADFHGPENNQSSYGSQELAVACSRAISEPPLVQEGCHR